MADLFSSEWMQAFGEQWNAEPELADALSKIHFNSVIGYGFEHDPRPEQESSPFKPDGWFLRGHITGKS
jgi:hypothetical protein